MEDNMKAAFGNREFRPFLTYVVFVVLFSVVTFISKPSSVQYEINTMHKDNFSPDEDSASSSMEDVYSLLLGDYADNLFPSQNADGNYMMTELELVEPSLFFRHDPAAADRLADAVLKRLS